ncbi:cyclin-like protein [Fusarium solani]|uniref:Cyclin-like protein n=1 Tax=Fusarium solani TaxID=169388 RepID=A0A9P9FXC2_FUSSL|nr:cyclin-like protein [Fusarium solani]KAH7223453.1 cyclin-like protein [Fusarium solani]
MASHQSLTSKEASSLHGNQQQEIIARGLSCLIRDEYLVDIMRHREYMEHKTLPDATLIDKQPQIEWSMRSGLMDFLVKVHAIFELLPETLFLAVNLLDRYCSKRHVTMMHYPLVGCTALLISAKYNDEKRRIPKIHQLKAMCCNMHSINMFILMEKHVLNALDWVIGHPTSDSFSQQLVEEEGEDREVEHMAAYLREIALYHRDFVSTKPSIMARTSLALARTILGRGEFNDGERDQPDYLKLSSHLQDPSPILVFKYSIGPFPKTAQKLAKFVAKNAELSPNMIRTEHTKKYGGDLNSPP